MQPGGLDRMAVLMRPGWIRTTLCVLAVAAAARLVSFRSMYEPDSLVASRPGPRDCGRPPRADEPLQLRLRRLSTELHVVVVRSRRVHPVGPRRQRGDPGGAGPAHCGDALVDGARVPGARLERGDARGLRRGMGDPRATGDPATPPFFVRGDGGVRWLVERARAGRSARLLVWVPLLIAVWANVHVECMFGIGFVALFGLCEWVRPRTLPRGDAAKVIGIAVAALACTALTPMASACCATSTRTPSSRR